MTAKTSTERSQLRRDRQPGDGEHGQAALLLEQHRHPDQGGGKPPLQGGGEAERDVGAL